MYTLQWQIRDFSKAGGGVQIPKVGVQNYYDGHFSQKLHGIEKKLNIEGDTRLVSYPSLCLQCWLPSKFVLCSIEYVSDSMKRCILCEFIPSWYIIRSIEIFFCKEIEKK